MQRFTVDGVAVPCEVGLIWLTCDRCFSWHIEVDAAISLADLVQRADEHTEVCR
jgi:hypothetical protein